MSWTVLVKSPVIPQGSNIIVTAPSVTGIPAWYYDWSEVITANYTPWIWVSSTWWYVWAVQSITTTPWFMSWQYNCSYLAWNWNYYLFTWFFNWDNSSTTNNPFIIYKWNWSWRTQSAVYTAQSWPSWNRSQAVAHILSPNIIRIFRTDFSFPSLCYYKDYDCLTDTIWAEIFWWTPSPVYANNTYASLSWHIYKPFTSESINATWASYVYVQTVYE